MMILMRSEMTLNYWVIVERYPFPNGVVGNLIPAANSSPYSIEQKVVK
jgi:hypothetical protein